jgi:DNA-binding response OmpR family regulator
VKKVLVVDDSRAEAALISSVLRQAGYEPVELHDARSLEQTAAVVQPCVILLDVVMPERNGFQACRELKQIPALSNIPVIMVSSKANESDRFWASQQGAADYVTKPFSTEQLLGTILKVAR